MSPLPTLAKAKPDATQAHNRLLTFYAIYVSVATLAAARRPFYGFTFCHGVGITLWL